MAYWIDPNAENKSTCRSYYCDYRTHIDKLPRMNVYGEEQENDTQKKEYAESKGYNYMVVDYREHLPELTLQRFKKMFEKYVMNN